MTNAKELWDKWDSSLLNDDYAKKRLISAKSKKLTPVFVNRDDCFACFQGSHGRYETFLDSCPCGDFRRSKRPCKHIFRLALELGVLAGQYEADNSAIPPVVTEQLPLSDALDIVERLGDGAQRIILDIARSTTSNKPEKRVKISPALEEVVVSGVVEITSSSPKSVVVRFSDKFNRSKIHKYLHRKYDSVDFLTDDENMKYVQIPLLETILPDDDVTAELKKRGYGENMGKSGITSSGIASMTISLGGDSK